MTAILINWNFERLIFLRESKNCNKAKNKDNQSTKFPKDAIIHIGLYLGRKIAIAHYDRKMSCKNHYFVISYFVNAIYR